MAKNQTISPAPKHQSNIAPLQAESPALRLLREIDDLAENIDELHGIQQVLDIMAGSKDCIPDHAIKSIRFLANSLDISRAGFLAIHIHISRIYSEIRNAA